MINATLSGIFLLAIDQGTSSTRAMIFDQQGAIHGQAQLPFQQFYPQNAWVEHDPEEIWRSTQETCRQAVQLAGLSCDQIAAIGISNQRETTLIWDRQSGQPLYPAIVWQDRRTSAYCRELAEKNNRSVDDLDAFIQRKTGLLLDPYFSASKIRWVLDHIPNAQCRAEKGELAFGTIDSFLLWRLTQGKVHATDATNASRTLLFNIHTQQWDVELCQLFNIPLALLPQVKDSSAHFALASADFLGQEIPITALVGDQQAATVGQGCFKAGMVKSTYGTGSFLLMNTGQEAVSSRHRLLTTVAYRLNNQVTYGLEGSNFIAGAAIQWLRDELGLLTSSAEVGAILQQTPHQPDLYCVPAFTGLGAPYWDPDARGAILGITRNTNKNQLIRATVEAIAYQTRDLIEAMRADTATPITELRVDGGMAENSAFLQCLSDILGITIVRPRITETSALGAAYLAGLAVGTYVSLEEISHHWQAAERFQPKLDEVTREQRYQGWLRAVARVKGF